MGAVRAAMVRWSAMTGTVTGMFWYAVFAAAGAAALTPAPRARRSMFRGAYGGAAVRERCGMAALLASVCARLRGGGTVTEALERYAERPFATRTATLRRWHGVLERVRTRDETVAQVRVVAFEAYAACRLSELSGCETVRCLEVVAADYRRLRMTEDLRRNAFAMPRATVRLLSALPFVTLGMGMLLGADPVAFLFGSAGGVTCLLLGSCCYLLGLAWLRILLADSGVRR